MSVWIEGDVLLKFSRCSGCLGGSVDVSFGVFLGEGKL